MANFWDDVKYTLITKRLGLYLIIMGIVSAIPVAILHMSTGASIIWGFLVGLATMVLWMATTDV